MKPSLIETIARELFAGDFRITIPPGRTPHLQFVTSSGYKPPKRCTSQKMPSTNPQGRESWNGRHNKKPRRPDEVGQRGQYAHTLAAGLKGPRPEAQGRFLRCGIVPTSAWPANARGCHRWAFAPDREFGD
jgi:hypothetical protein